MHLRPDHARRLTAPGVPGLLTSNRSSTLRIILTGITAFIGSASAQAQFAPPGPYDRMDVEGINEPYDPPRAINFDELLASVPADSQPAASGSSRPDHRTVTQELAVATDIFRLAIPAGTSTTDATAKLRKAGADCTKPKGFQLVCHYILPASPDDRIYSNTVRWQVRFGISNGKVTNPAVSRR